MSDNITPKELICGIYFVCYGWLTKSNKVWNSVEILNGFSLRKPFKVRWIYAVNLAVDHALVKNRLQSYRWKWVFYKCWTKSAWFFFLQALPNRLISTPAQCVLSSLLYQFLRTRHRAIADEAYCHRLVCLEEAQT